MFLKRAGHEGYKIGLSNSICCLMQTLLAPCRPCLHLADRAHVLQHASLCINMPVSVYTHVSLDLSEVQSRTDTCFVAGRLAKK